MKKLLFGNLSTKFMALFLAALTWMYLFTQDTDQNNLDILFMPRIDTRDFASVSFATSEEKPRPLTPGQLFNVRVTGPKGDVKALRPRTFKCEPLIDPEKLNAKEGHGEYSIGLDRKDFDLPDKFSVDPLLRSTIRLRYVKFVTRKIRIFATSGRYEGYPAPGHKVVAITPVPAEIEAKVPADRPEPIEAAIRYVQLDGNQSSFTVPGELEDPLIKPVRAFEVRVDIQAEPKTARLTLDLSLNARPEHLKRITLMEKSIVIELQGPEELVREAEKRPAVFQPYVTVTDTDMEPAGERSLGSLGCHVLDPKYKDKIAIVLKPDDKPENRQVKIKVTEAAPAPKD